MKKTHPKKRHGPVWYNRGKLGIRGKFYALSNPAFSFTSDMATTFFPPQVGVTDIRLPAPSPTLLALLADLPLSGCWPAVVDRIIEEYPETEPYIRPVLEAYDASTSTVSETDTVGAYSSAK